MKPVRDPQRVVAILGIGAAISLLGDATLYTVLPSPVIASQVGVTLANVGLLLAANRAVRLFLNGPVGLLYDHFPRRRMLIGSLLLGTFSSVLYALGFGFWPFLAGRILWGLAWSFLWIGANAIVLDISSDENRGRHSGQLQMWFFIGVAGSSLLGGLLTDWIGFRPTLWFSAAIIAAGTMLWVFFLPETRPAGDPHQRRAAALQSNSPESFPWPIALAGALAVFVARFVSWSVLAATSILWLSGLVGEGLFLSGRLIPLASLTGIYVALSMLTSIAGAPLAGRLSDRLGRRWPVVVLTNMLAGLGIFLMSLKITPLAVFGAFLAPIVGGSIESLIPAILGDHIHKQHRGRGLGLINTFGDLGATVGPAVGLALLNTERLTLSDVYQGCATLLLMTAAFSLLPLRAERRAVRERNAFV